MMGFIDRLLRWRKGETVIGTADASDFDATLRSARHMSEHRDNRNSVVVVVELGSEFNVKTGMYGDQRYNYYTFRSGDDFHRIANLKAAYLNGRRVDDMDRGLSTRLVTHGTPHSNKEG